MYEHIIYYCYDLVVTYSASTQQCRLHKSEESSQVHQEPEWHNTRLSFTFSFCADPLHFTIPPQRHPIADLAISNPSPLPCPALAYTGPSKMDLPSHSKNGWEIVTLSSVSISLPSSPQPNTPLAQYAACQWQVRSKKIHQTWQDKKAAGKVRNRISPNYHNIRMMHIPKTSHVKWKIFFSPPCLLFFFPFPLPTVALYGIPTPAAYT